MKTDEKAKAAAGELAAALEQWKGAEMTYRFKKSVPVGYDRQGYIYFKSRLYRQLSKEDRDAIAAHCRRCGGEYWRALLEFVTRDTTATKVCMKYYISQSTLERMVRRYYAEFPKDL